MAHSTLALHHTLDFHNALGACLDRYVEQVSRIYERSTLPLCSYEYPESSVGACDGQPCCEKGTVHDLASDQPYCSLHFLRVNLGEVSRG